MDFETKSSVFITAFFIWRQLSEELSFADDAIDVPIAVKNRQFIFVVNRDIAIMAHLEELQPGPVSGRRSRGNTGDSFCHTVAIQANSGTNGIIINGCQNNRVLRVPQDLHDAANSIIDIQSVSSCGKSGTRA